MTEENVKKIGFFKRIYLSVKEFEKYVMLASENISVAIKYLLKLMLIFVFVITCIFMYQFYTYFQKSITYFNENIEELHFVNGELSIDKGDKKEIINENSVIPYILVDTDANTETIEEYNKKLGGYETGIIILKDKIIYKNGLLNNGLEYKYSDIIEKYNINEFNKQDVLNFILQINNFSSYASIFIAMFISLYIVYTFSTIIDVFMLAILGFIVARIAGMKMRFKATFNIGIYALTLPILLNIVYIIINNFTGFEIKYFSWMYTTISYIYVIVAILLIKTDFIDKQAELMKIVEEQEKVRQEIIEREKQKKNEEDKNENKDNKDNKEEKKKQKKDGEDGISDDGLAPQNTK
jgi:hypothetical protein